MKTVINYIGSKYNKKPLYDRLGGIFAIAAVVDKFSDAVLASPVVGVGSPNAALDTWSRYSSGTRLPGLKFQRTLWVAAATGGPQVYSPTNRGENKMDLSAAHKQLKITSAEFDTVAQILKATLNQFEIPQKEQAEVLAAFLAHKHEVVNNA